jgi:putative acyl-CoA dehydrogenase
VPERPARVIAAGVSHGPAGQLTEGANGEAEAGRGCPISMTYAAVPALRHSPELDARFSPLLATLVYQPGMAPPDGKAGLLAGMAMTEKQGGSDVRSNTTMARPVPGEAVRRTGCAA